MDPVLSRRSIRKYTDQPVDNVQIKMLLKAAMVAPSAGDERPWQFVVISNRHILGEIANLHPFAHMTSHATVAILVCGDKSLQKYCGFWVQDCAAATENVLIEAQQLGLGAVWVGIYPIQGRVQGFRQLLDIPEHVIPFALIPVGHPAEKKKPAKRFDASRIHFDGWSQAG